MITASMFFKENTTLYFEKAPQAKKKTYFALTVRFSQSQDVCCASLNPTFYSLKSIQNIQKRLKHYISYISLKR